MDVFLLIFKLSIVMLVGFIGGQIAKKMKLPNVSGYLIVGLLLGPTMGLIFRGYPGFVTAEESDALKFISEIALAFIAFSIGSEFVLKTIKKMGKSIMVLTIFEVVGAVVVVFLSLLFLKKPDVIVGTYSPFSKNNIAFGLILASMAAATAPAATLMVIRQYRAYGPVSKSILPITALDDILGIVVFGFFISIAKILVPSGEALPLGLVISKPFIEVFGSIIIGGILGFLLAKINNVLKTERDDNQILTVLTILLTIGLISIINNMFSSQGIALSQLLANIMVGTMVANFSKKPEKHFTSIGDMSSPFYVLFFVLAGASLDLKILGTESLILLLSIVFIIARALGKTLGIYFGAKIMKSPDTVRKYLGIALLPQGGISIGLLVIVYAQMRDFYPVISTIIMLSILVYETMGPVFAKYAITKAGEINGLDKFEELSNLDYEV